MVCIHEVTFAGAYIYSGMLMLNEEHPRSSIDSMYSGLKTSAKSIIFGLTAVAIVNNIPDTLKPIMPVAFLLGCGAELLRPFR